MASSAAVSDVLGVRKPRAGVSADAAIVEQIREGLPVKALDRLAAAVAPNDLQFAHSMVKRATLTRRRSDAAGRLSVPESERVVRLAKVWAFAVEVWKSETEARDFLHRPNALLEGRPPLDIVLESELGGPRVEALLGQLLYGSAA